MDTYSRSYYTRGFRPCMNFTALNWGFQIGNVFAPCPRVDELVAFIQNRYAYQQNFKTFSSEYKQYTIDYKVRHFKLVKKNFRTFLRLSLKRRARSLRSKISTSFTMFNILKWCFAENIYVLEHLQFDPTRMDDP